MLDQWVDEILGKPIALKEDIQQLAFWIKDLMRINEDIAHENGQWIDRVIELEKMIDFFRSQYLIVVKCSEM